MYRPKASHLRRVSNGAPQRVQAQAPAASKIETFMTPLRRFVGAAVIASGLVACGPAKYYMPNVIMLSPAGTLSNPAPQSISRSFTLTAAEDGYTGEFTAQVVAGTCWVVLAPITNSGAWTVAPQGTTCPKLDTEKILVKDQKGNSAVTYIRSTL